MDLPCFKNYERHAATQSCYMDVRYFDRVLANYKGYVTEPLKISLILNGDDVYHSVSMKDVRINPKYIGVIRISIKVKTLMSDGTFTVIKHSNALIFENNIAYLVDPFWKSSELSQNIHLMVRKYIMKHMNILGVDHIVDTDLTAKDIKQQSTYCPQSGFCAGYILLFIYTWLTNLSLIHI